ncbi:MAG: hypothetical protein KDH93_17615 [Rhodoferax sp.]|nr:hypothetical protein [Rhodoferax sp.]MCP5263629.1 hypothetical protein [Rhodoferax sp.]
MARKIIPDAGSGSAGTPFAGPAWAELPLSDRYRHALAQRRGIKVWHDGQHWIWEATSRQLIDTGFYREQDLNFKRHRRGWTAEGMRAHIYRKHEENFILEHEYSGGPSKNARAYAPILKRASTDSGYQRFRAAMVLPVEGESV